MFLNEFLIDAVNSQKAWCLVGSGPSAMAGAPNWEQLAIGILTICSSPDKPLTHDRDFHRWCKDPNSLPRAFEWLVTSFGRPAVEASVETILQGVPTPGPVHILLASWPFTGYVTSNYDRLLEDALTHDKLAWETVGNSAGQNQLISRDASQLIWHMHGVMGAPDKNTRLVLTKEDYDELYSAGSPTLAALESLLRWKRVIIVGFGFRDADLVRVFERVKRVTNPSMPAFAFLANKSEAECREFLDTFNVEVISYRADTNDHRGLLHVLNAYSALIVPRNVRYAVHTAGTPEYATNVTSVLTHNCLLRHESELSADALLHLARAWLLHHIAEHAVSANDVMAQQPGALRHASVIGGAITILSQEGMIHVCNGIVQLTPAGQQLIANARGEAERMEQRFAQQIRKRVEHLNNPALDIDRVTNAATGYFVDLGRTCGTGIAQRLATKTEALAQVRQTALMTALHKYWERCGSHEECTALIAIATSVLSDPTGPEKMYLGNLAQSYFGEHVLDLEPHSLRLRQEHISQSVFILDANVVIQFLAVGSRFHAIAKEVVQGVLDAHGTLVITEALLREVRNHARWGYAFLKRYGTGSRELVDAGRAAAGYGNNAFVEGFTLAEDFGPGKTFQEYFDHCINSCGDIPRAKALRAKLQESGIVVHGVWSIATGTEAELEAVVNEIRAKRMQFKTYKHDTQVRAEAEVALMIAAVRNHDTASAKCDWKDAYFVSPSRVIDTLTDIPHWIGIAPQGLIEWLATTRNASRTMVDVLFELVLNELADAGIEVVPQAQLLRVFAPLIDASRNRFEQVCDDNIELIREMYGADPREAFTDVDALAWPDIVHRVEMDIVNRMKSQVAVAETARYKAESKAALTEKERRALETLRRKEGARRAKSKRRVRRARSKPKKKKHKGKR